MKKIDIMPTERQEKIRQLRREWEELFNSDLIFLLKSANIFALMAYDIVSETNKAVREYNEKTQSNYFLSLRFKRAVKKMNEHREQMGHFALSATKELTEVLNEAEDSSPIQALSLYQTVVDTYGCFAELLAALLLQINENPQELKNLWNLLLQQNKVNVMELPTPNWKELEKLSTINQKEKTE